VTLRFGPLCIEARAIQAALSGYSDLPMRRVARAFGAKYAIHEVVLDEIVVQPGKLQREILHVEDDDHPTGGQILGATPETFAEAAGLLVGAGYDVVDVNFGCPVKKVLGRARGGYLLSDPETALAILAAVRDVVPPTVPMTVKMRRAMDDDPQSEEKFWRILEGAFALGVDGVCVHGRTVKQRYVGPARRSFLGEVKRRHPTRTILGSGDVFTAQAAVDVLNETGVDGVWVARGSIGAPWIFRQIERLLATGDRGPPPSFAEQCRAVRLHLDEAIRHYGFERGSRSLRRFGFRYAAAHPRAEQVAADFGASRVPDDVLAVVDRWYDDRVDHGPVAHADGPILVAAGAVA
jgi:tRNA-dihydrouridine synthase B